MGYFVYGEKPSENFFLFANPNKTGTHDYYLHMDMEDVSFRNQAFVKNIGIYYDAVEVSDSVLYQMFTVAVASQTRNKLRQEFAKYFRYKKSKL